MTYWLGYFTVLILGTILCLSLFKLFSHAHRPISKVRGIAGNFTLSLMALFFTFMIIEFCFKVFFAQSDGFRYTLASQNWYDQYWQENSLGFRDVEWTPEQLAGKIKVMVVGDSLVAGSGIGNPEDRFANQLGRLLGDDYIILNVASPGWSTGDEIKAILNYPYRPDLLILSYYINDIEGVAYQSGVQRPEIRRDPPAWLSPLVQNSYAINFLYWRVMRLGPQEWAKVYWDWLAEISNDPNIKWRHRQELLTIVEGAASEQISLFVVVFPNLAAVEESQFITQPLVNFFQEQGVPVLDVSPLLAGLDPAETMASPVDAHPNEAINLMVAEHLYQMIRANE